MGERHRVTLGGPGVTPVMQVEVQALTKADSQRDSEFNSVFDQVMAGDRICAGDREVLRLSPANHDRTYGEKH